MLNLQTFTVSHLMAHAGRGVYPYLPMATNAPWSFFVGGVNKKLLKHVFALYSLPIIFSKNPRSLYARAIAFYPQLTNAICFTIYFFIFSVIIPDCQLPKFTENCTKLGIKCPKIVCWGGVGGGEAWRKREQS